jgi:hypothetical protein
MTARPGATGLMDISVVLISYNTAGLLATCLERIGESTAACRREVIVVDNASRDGSAGLVRMRHPECRLIENAENVGFARAGNQALRSATGRYVLLLNTDAFVEPDTIEKTVAYMDAHQRCGILGVKLVAPNGELHPSARYFPTPWNIFVARAGLERFFKGARMVDDMNWDHAAVRHCDWVPGCYYLVRKALIDEVGLFDPRYFLYYEEVDHCLAARKAGWDVVFFPDTTVVHIGGQSALSEGAGITVRSGPELEALRVESELLYFRKNHGLAGVWANVLLGTLADALIVLKRLLKWKLPAGFAAQAKHCALVWSLFRRTRWGARPTR